MFPGIDKTGRNGFTDTSLGARREIMRNYKSPIDEAVLSFTESRDRPFTLKTAARSVGARLKEPAPNLEEAVEETLVNDPWVFFDFQNKQYIPRANFFKGKKFLIAPTNEEMYNGYLIPGHRLIPFASRLIHPADCSFEIPGGKRLARKRISRSLRELEIYFSLFNTNTLFDYLFSDSRNNGRVLEKPDGMLRPLSVRVLDMAAWYKEVGFREGDTLLMTVLDWKNGRFRLEHRPKPRSNRRRLSDWCGALEETLLEFVFDVLGPATDIHEQLSLALFLGDPVLLRSPQIHIGGFLRHLQEITLTRLGGEPIFWFRGESPEEALLEYADLSRGEAQGASGSIDDILADLGLAFGQDELEAYMRDELFHGGKSLENVMARCMAGRPEVSFYNEEQEEAFDDFVQVLWQGIRENYNRFVDQRAGKVRAEGLSILDNVLNWMRDMDQAQVSLSELPKKEFVELSGMMAVLTEMIISLNHEGPTREEIDSVRAGVEQIGARIRASMEVLRPQPGKQSRPLFRVIQGGANQDSRIYQLKISLEDVSPPVWRRLLVRGDTTLAELHQIILAVMDWAPGRLHIFQKEGMLVGDRDESDITDIEEDGAPVHDESELMIGHIFKNLGERMVYEYDFANSWRHEILVETISNAGEDGRYPRCLEGSGSRPPEGIDGVPAYRKMLKVLADPRHPDFADVRSRTGPDFDPERFDLDAANRQLRAKTGH